MKKLRCLLLDANIVFQLFESHLWDEFVNRCEVILSETVKEHEVKYYHGARRDYRIDLSADVESGRIRQVHVEIEDLNRFRERFSPVYLEQLDPGEAESLAYLCQSQEPCLLCSSDAIVFRVLGLLNRVEQGLSLEEILAQIGLGRALPYQFTKSFRDRWTKRGQEDMIKGAGLK